MPSSPLTRRAQILEEKVESLERLPPRIEALESQILQFWEEVRVEFSATREGLRAEIRDGDEETRRQVAPEPFDVSLV